MTDFISDKPTSLDDRPLVTFALFAYNQERYIGDAVLAALSQTYSPLEIILSDDCSSDATFSVVQQIVRGYAGPHAIILNRNANNLGVCAHVNKVFGLASGQLIVVAAGDDVSLPERCQRMVDVWLEKGASALYCESNVIDDTGKIVGHWKLPSKMLQPLKIGCGGEVLVVPFYGAAAGYDKQVFTRFGNLPTNIRNEDYSLAMRAALLNGVYCINETLMNYRKHADNLSYWVKYSNERKLFSKLFLMAQSLENNVVNQRVIIGTVNVACGSNSPLVHKFRDLMTSTRIRCGLLYALSGRYKADMFRDMNLTKSELLLEIVIESIRLVLMVLKISVSKLHMRIYAHRSMRDGCD